MACRIVNRMAADPRSERDEVVAGLAATPATLSPKYFYDAIGCALYGAICELPEYYPTRTELDLFRRERAEIAAALGKHKQFVDLGAGDCAKAAGWLGLLAPRRYLAVDIAEQEMDAALGRVARDFPDVEMVGVVMDFSRSLDLGTVKRRFARGETIHSENSYKYTAPEFERLLADAGFRNVRRWSSADEGYFVFFAS